MRKIRRNVFETNSSSSHSIAISNKDRGYDFNLPVDEDGVLHIPFGTFGWGPHLLKTPLQKLSYYITDNCPYNNVEADIPFDETSIDVLKNKPKMKEVLDLIKEHCPQVEDITFESSNSIYHPFGYVDHESVGTSKEIDLFDLIFNNSVIIVIDNDNSHYYSEYTVCIDENPLKEELFDKTEEEIRAKIDSTPHWGKDWY